MTHYPPPPTRFSRSIAGTVRGGAAEATRVQSVVAQPSAVRQPPRQPVPPPPTRFAASAPAALAGMAAQRKPASFAGFVPPPHSAPVAQPFCGKVMRWLGSFFASEAADSDSDDDDDGQPPVPRGAVPIGLAPIGMPPAVAGAPAGAARRRITPEENRQNQLAAAALRREAERRQKEIAAAQKAAKEQKRREAGRKQRESDEAKAELNRQALAARRAADRQREADIDVAANDIVGQGLSRQTASFIANAAKSIGKSAATARGELQAALTTQLSPTVERWRFKLSMDRYVIRRQDAAGRPFPPLGGHAVHITISHDSIATAPGAITGRTANVLLDRLLSSAVRENRIHATEEGSEPANHYFYGDVVGAGRADKQHLKDVLDGFVDEVFLPRVQDALARHGDI